MLVNRQAFKFIRNKISIIKICNLILLLDIEFVNVGASVLFLSGIKYIQCAIIYYILFNMSR
jgi:hypothetical protein